MSDLDPDSEKRC